ncbi:MAG TPA: YhdP family protein [Usitatibacter sp.]
MSEQGFASFEALQYRSHRAPARTGATHPREDRRIKALPRICIRLATGIATFALLAFALAVMWLRYDALPNVDRYRGRIVASMSEATGMNVSARFMRGGWEGLRPYLSLEGFAIADGDGKVALGFDRAELTLSWWSLLRGNVRFHDVNFYRPSLVLRRSEDGLIYLGSQPLNKAGPDDGRFSEWLLAQPRLGIHGATLAWRDEKARAPEVLLENVEIAVSKHLGRHRVALTAYPPRALASHIDIRADLKFTREETRWLTEGDVYFETRDADLGVLRTHMPVPESLRSGVGSLRVWGKLAGADGVKEVVADLNMRDAKAQLASDALPLELATLSGRATYRAEPDGFTFATEKFRFRLANGVDVRPGNFSLSRRGRPERVAVQADGIDLKIAAALLDYFPVPKDLKTQVLRFAPRGRIMDANVSWAAADPASDYAVKGRFEDLAVNAVENYPGGSGMTGSIDGTQAGGQLRIAAKNAAFDAPNVFRAPLLLDALEANATWKHAGNGLEVALSEIHLANADGEMRASGAWHALQHDKDRSPGYIDMKGTIVRAQLNRVAAYLPNRIAPARDWVDRSVLDGATNHADFEMRGDLWHFPWGSEAEGHFVVSGPIRDARLRYHPDWPSVDAIQGSLKFENRRVEIHADRATIFASRASGAIAVIDNLGAHPPVLTITGDIDTSGADTVRFLRESPLVNGPGSFTKAVALDGPARLKLQLIYPLSGVDPLRVVGDYNFNGVTATVGRSLVMRDVKGRLTFTERGVRAPQINGTLFDKPAVLSMGTQPDGQVMTQVDGRIETDAMGAWVPPPMLAKLSGGFDWKARLVSGRQGSELVVTSDMKGLASTLPVPFAKGPDDARDAKLTMSRLGGETEVSTVALDGGAYGRFGRDADGRWNVALKFGTPVETEPVREGLWLYGQLPFLDVDAWQGVFAMPRATKPAPDDDQGLVLRGIDMKLDRTHYLGREFRQMGARLERKGAQWAGALESPLVSGNVQWTLGGKGRLVAKLDRLSIQEPSPTSGAVDTPQVNDTDLPSLDVTAERFDFGGHRLGRLDLKAEPDGEEWRIDKLDIVNEHAKFTSVGRWRRTGPDSGSLTTLDLKLETDSLNSLLTQFNYGEYVKRGDGRLDGALVWSGYPYEFALAKLAGKFKVRANYGQFAKIDPGAGKLLGLISLQSLPQRASFDFQDVFSAGFAFDRIEGDVRIARGVMLTDNFEIQGPSAFVKMKGEISLPGETQNLTMRIVPEVGESVALAATVFGTPILGLSTLLVSKVLKNPFGQVVAYEYQVTGSWDNPQLTKLSGPPKAEAQAAPTAATQAQP